MSDVILCNPGLPPDQWIRVSKDSLAHYARSGWQPVPEDEVTARAQAEAEARAQAIDAMASPPKKPDGDTPADPDPGPEPEPQDPAAATADEAANELAPESPVAAASRKRSR